MEKKYPLTLHGLVIHLEKLPRISFGLINVSILGLIIRPLKEFIAFSQIDQKLTDASNSEERYAYLTTFTTHKAKNRFTAENQKKSSTKSFCKLSKLFK